MIRINRKNTEKARLAIADLQKARKSGKTYNTKSDGHWGQAPLTN